MENESTFPDGGTFDVICKWISKKVLLRSPPFIAFHFLKWPVSFSGVKAAGGEEMYGHLHGYKLASVFRLNCKSNS